MNSNCFALLGVVLCFSFPATAADSPMERATLRGMKAVKIVLDKLGDDLEREGLGKQQLQVDIGEKLRNAGIALDDKANEFLGLSTISARLKRGPYTVSYSLGVYQVVTLSRDKNIRTVAETWSTQSVLSVSPKLVTKISRTTIGELVDQFINAYREANPK
jgi:hypothetical protein